MRFDQPRVKVNRDTSMLVAFASMRSMIKCVKSMGASVGYWHVTHLRNTSSLQADCDCAFELGFDVSIASDRTQAANIV